jgi:hypothetical protein
MAGRNLIIKSALNELHTSKGYEKWEWKAVVMKNPAHTFFIYLEIQNLSRYTVLLTTRVLVIMIGGPVLHNFRAFSFVGLKPDECFSLIAF